MIWNRRGNVRGLPPSSPPPTDPAAEDAWKALALVIDLVKHAETKAGLTLASAGAIGGVAYSLVKSVLKVSVLFGVSAGLCGLCATLAAFSAGMALVPRTRSEPTNPLYYHHAATRFGAHAEAYIGELNALVRRPEVLVPAIAQQVWANAMVAHQKYRWAGLALYALLGAVATLAITAAIAVIQSL